MHQYLIDLLSGLEEQMPLPIGHHMIMYSGAGAIEIQLNMTEDCYVVYPISPEDFDLPVSDLITQILNYTTTANKGRMC